MLEAAPVRSLALAFEGAPVPGWCALVGKDALKQLEQHGSDLLLPRQMASLRSEMSVRRRHSLLLGRHAAKSALAAYFGERDLSNIEIRSGTFGQPLSAYPCECSPGLSLAHCDGLAIALASSPDHILGVDVERCAPERADAIRSEMTPAELGLHRQDSLSEISWLFLLWTMKEALSKALRVGLTVPFGLLETRDVRRSDADSGYVAFFTNFAQYRCHS